MPGCPRPSALARGVVLAVATAAVLWVVAGGPASPALAASSPRTVTLVDGYNPVVWSGPDQPAAELATALPLRAVWRWDAAAQRFDVYRPSDPTANTLDLVHSGDAIWLDVDTAATWSIPAAGLPAFVTLHGGWNFVPWLGDAAPPDDALASLGARLEAAYVYDAESQRYLGYAPTVAPALNDLTRLDSLDALWLRIAPGPPLVWRPAGVATPADAAAGVLLVDSGDGAGSGFLVTDALIITAAHVAGDAEWLTVWAGDGQTARARVVARDIPRDLAIARLDRPLAAAHPLDWTAAAPAQPADPVWVWGYPEAGLVLAAGFTQAPTVSTGIVSARRLRDGVAYLQVDAAVNGGSSGGPVLDARGRVVGMVSLLLRPGGDDLEGMNFAVDLVAERDHLAALLAAAADA